MLFQKRVVRTKFDIYVFMLDYMSNKTDVLYETLATYASRALVFLGIHIPKRFSSTY